MVLPVFLVESKMSAVVLGFGGYGSPFELPPQSDLP